MKTKKTLTLNSFEHLEYTLCDVVNLWKRSISQRSKTLGISVIERRALITIRRYPGCTQAEIARHIDLEPQNLTRILDKLSDLGWIEKKPDPQDRRANRLYATDKAEATIQKFFKISDKLRPQVLSNLSESEVKKLQELLLKIKANLESEPD